MDRFMAKVEKIPGVDCWIWTGAVTSCGYGNFVFNKKSMPASRASYMLHRGDIPNGMLVCHRCDNRLCVRPDHLFLGTAKDNAQDALRKGRLKLHDVGKSHREQTHCKHGHPFDLFNTIPRIRNGSQCRECRACRDACNAKHHAKRRGGLS